jgi:hypothetical protein
MFFPNNNNNNSEESVVSQRLDRIERRIAQELPLMSPDKRDELVDHIVSELSSIIEAENHDDNITDASVVRAKFILTDIDDLIDHSLEKEEEGKEDGEGGGDVDGVASGGGGGGVKDEGEDKGDKIVLNDINTVAVHYDEDSLKFRLDTGHDALADVVDVNAFIDTRTSSSASSSVSQPNRRKNRRRQLVVKEEQEEQEEGDDDDDDESASYEFMSECRYMVGMSGGIWYSRTVCLKDGLLWAQPLNPKTV